MTFGEKIGHHLGLEVGRCTDHDSVEQVRILLGHLETLSPASGASRERGNSWKRTPAHRHGGRACLMATSSSIERAHRSRASISNAALPLHPVKRVGRVILLCRDTQTHRLADPVRRILPVALACPARNLRVWAERAREIYDVIS